jgi:hypothetical protein
MNPTPKQRAVIYRKAAELIDSGKCETVLDAIFKITGFYAYRYDELNYFYPDRKGELNKELRVNILLFAEQIAKQK